jgi:hypothetical protein
MRKARRSPGVLPLFFMALVYQKRLELTMESAENKLYQIGMFLCDLYGIPPGVFPEKTAVHGGQTLHSRYEM